MAKSVSPISGEESLPLLTDSEHGSRWFWKSSNDQRLENSQLDLLGERPRPTHADWAEKAEMGEYYYYLSTDQHSSYCAQMITHHQWFRCWLISGREQLLCSKWSIQSEYIYAELHSVSELTNQLGEWKEFKQSYIIFIKGMFLIWNGWPSLRRKYRPKEII